MSYETDVRAGDAADRLVLDTAASLLPGAAVVAIGSPAVALGALAAGAASVRVHLDDVAPLGDRDLVNEDLSAELLAGADLVLLRLPKSLDALDELARLIAAHAAPDVVVIAGGRLKYMTLGMNGVLQRSFGRLDVSLARQKSRVLTARMPLAVEPVSARRSYQSDLDLWVCAVGGVFAGASVDIGTRAMLGAFDRLPAFETAIDFGCGTGILAAELKRLRPGARVIASDASAAAVASARATAEANGLDVEVIRDAGLSAQPDASVDLVVLNPPFHDGGRVTTDIAIDMFAEAARVLRPGGELWTVWNSHLRYRNALQRLVGPTREISRTAKFTVSASALSSDRLSPSNSAAN